MLSYQHGYHAGNFADVIKHLTLTQLLRYLTKKDKPIFYLETHSGRGFYDLLDGQATKTGEANHGIRLLWNNRETLPEIFLPYLNCIEQQNSDQMLRYYPGSPALAIHFLREQDRLFLCELHPKEFEYLQGLPQQGKRVFFSKTDGLEKLTALLPPPERRGLIFIDPSYEIKADYRMIPELLKSAFRRFSTGSYCIWYPIVDKKLHQQLINGLKNIGADSNLQVEFNLTNLNGLGMTGCGLWIINPPYVLKSELEPALKALCKLFNPGGSSYYIDG